MFIGAKMLANPWVHISTGLSLAFVGGIIALSILISVFQANLRRKPVRVKTLARGRIVAIEVTPEFIGHLADDDLAERASTASRLFSAGLARAFDSLQDWEQDEELQGLMARVDTESVTPMVPSVAKITVGIAVLPETFDKIRAACGSPPLADAPADQEVSEFELEFSDNGMRHVRLDILTTKGPGRNTAIARFLEKFGEGIQQVELDVTDVDRATEILRTRFHLEPIYPATRPGANGTRVNFFLIELRDGQKVLVELVEQPK